MLRTSLWLVRPGVGHNFESLCAESLFVFNFLFCFYHLFFSFCSGCVLFSQIESFGLVLSFEFFVFYSIVVRLESGLQKNNLSSFNLVLIWFGDRGFFFLGHAISLSFVTFVNCVGYCSLLNIIPSNRVIGKFETCEKWLELLSVKVKT